MIIHCSNCNAEIDSRAKNGISYCCQCHKNFVFDKEAFKTYHATWRKDNPKYKATALKIVKKYQALHPDRVKLSEQKHDRREKEKLLKVFGRKCVLCGEEREKKIIFHQIKGQKHPRSYKYVIENIEDFTYICYSCHGHIHWVMNYLYLTWNQILSAFRVGQTDA
jgi:hypothetical protein